MARMTRKNYYGDSGRSMGLILNGHRHAATIGGNQKFEFSVNTIGRVLFPLSATSVNPRRLSSAVKSVVADLKK